MKLKSALVIIDMINDFVNGALKCQNPYKLISNIKQLILWAHNSNILVVYVNDEHNENDYEFKVWLKHALKDSYGSQIIDELKPNDKDIIFTKNHYNGFINTNLDSYLKQNQISKLYVCGLYTEICVREFVSTGFQLGYDISVLKDATKSKNKLKHSKTLKHLKEFYNVEIINTSNLIKKSST